MEIDVNVILIIDGIDNMCLNYFVEIGIIVVRRILKRDFKCIGKDFGVIILLILVSLEGKEIFEVLMLR